MVDYQRKRMKMKTLEQLEVTTNPEEKHWIIPNAVNEGVHICLDGAPGKVKDIIAAEIAISATTFTKFMGVIPPWIAAKTLYITKDGYDTAVIFRKLLSGRNIEVSPDDLRIVEMPNGITMLSEDLSQTFWDSVYQDAVYF